MAQVPYNPVPSVSLKSGATPYLRVPGSVEEAAGVGVARAEQGLGREISQSSNVIAETAIHLQNRTNEVNATNKTTAFEDALSNEVAGFDQLQGINAVNELPKFQERVRKLQQDALASATNPAERRMINQVTQRRTGYAIVDAGHKAGTRLRQAEDEAAKGRLESAQSRFDPMSPNLGRADLQTIEAEVEKFGRTHGMLPDTIANVKRKEVSKAWLTGFQKMSPNDPGAANELFEKVKDRLDPPVREQVQQIVNRNMAAHQTRIDADEIFKRAQFDPKKGTGQFQRLLDLAEPFKGRNETNPDYSDFLDNRIKSKFSTAMEGYRDTQRGYESSIGKFILGKDDQSRVVTIDGIVGPDAPQEVRDAYNALEPQAQRRINNWIAHAAQNKTIGWTTEGLKEYAKLKGMASDPESVEEFYNKGTESIFKAHIPFSAQRELLNLRDRVKTQANDLSLTRSMQDVEGLLQAAGISRRDNLDDYLRFRGAFEDQLRDYQTEHKRKVPPEEARKIASRLLQDMYKDTWWKFKTPVFKASDIPDTVKQRIIKDFQDRGYKVPPTDEQIQRGYAYLLYKQLYEKTEEKPK